ncbi:MAG: hypothetical protein ACYDCQ_16020 [Dehalococcoidia bacterium]
MSDLVNIHWRSKKSIAVLVVALVALAAGGVALAGEDTPDLSAPSPLGQATSVPSELSAAFSMLRGPRGQQALSSAAAAGAQTPGGLGEHYGVNPSLARLAGSPAGMAVWLIPGSTGSCMALERGGGACAPNTTVAAQGITIAVVPTTGAPATVYGIAPDKANVTATGSTGAARAVPLSGQAFSVSAADAVSYTVHTTAGSAVARALPSPPTSGPAN